MLNFKKINLDENKNCKKIQIKNNNFKNLNIINNDIEMYIKDSYINLFNIKMILRNLIVQLIKIWYLL